MKEKPLLRNRGGGRGGEREKKRPVLTQRKRKHVFPVRRPGETIVCVTAVLASTTTETMVDAKTTRMPFKVTLVDVIAT